MKYILIIAIFIIIGLFVFFVASLSCNHDFKYKQNVWGYDGGVLMHQYVCTKCGRKDYLIVRDDPDKDWNHGKGDGEL